VEFTVEMAIVMGVSALALSLFVFEILTADFVALLVVLAVMLSGVVAPEAALSGFSNPAVHTIAAMFVISAGLLRTGVVESFGRQLIRLGGSNINRLFALTLITVVVLSAFINNTPIVVMMIPVILGLCQAHGVPPSKLLIPISYASIFGGCCTLIGTSTNLVVSGMAEEAGLEPFGIFELAKVGLILAAIGVLYLVLFSRRLLPSRETVTSSIEGGKIKEYVTELVVRSGSPLIGRRLGDVSIRKGGKLRALEVIREEEILWPPLDAVKLRADDIILAKGPVNEILEARRESGVEIIPDLGPESVRAEARMNTLAELVVTPGSRFEGATVTEVGFHHHFGVSVLAVQRHGHHIRQKIGGLRMRVGDVLLVQGDAAAVEGMKEEDGIILLEGVNAAVVHRHRAPFALAIVAAFILAATFSPLPVVSCALAAALLMVLTRCVTVRQLYRSLDVRTLVLIAGMIGLGRAAAETGTAAWVAEKILVVIRPLGPYGVLAVIYLLTNLVTEFLSNAAAAVLMVPLAISTAQELGVEERPFLIAVAIAASAAFSTPVGYQTNTIVFGPGGYRFTDYFRVGAPLNLIFWLVATLLIPVFWPF